LHGLHVLDFLRVWLKWLRPHRCWRTRLNLCTLCLAGLGWAGTAWGQAPVPAPNGDDLYQQALRLIADGEPEQARAVLQRLMNTAPEHAGAWMDMAMLYCSMGQAEQAESLFATIEARFDPPPGIRELIALQRQQRCVEAQIQTQTQKQAPAWLRLGLGYDSNVNQGASSPNFSIGTGASLTSLVLSPDYTPKADRFMALSAELSQPWDAVGALAFAQVQARQYDTQHRYDLGHLLLGLERPWQLGRGWGLTGTATMGLTTLGGAGYQTQQQLALQLFPPLALPSGWKLGLQGGVTGVRYLTQSGFDSVMQEWRGVLNYRWADGFWQASLGQALDKGSAVRPGNDRRGTLAHITGRWQLTPGVLGELWLNYQSWAGQQPYAPGLIDQIRRQKTQLVRLALVFPMGAKQSLHVELRNVQNRENISIFEYGSQSLQVGWQWQL